MEEKEGIYRGIMQIRISDMIDKIKAEKRKMRDEVNKNRVIKSEILSLVIELNSLDVIEDIDGIHELMRSIEEKYEIDDKHRESDLGRLYAEVLNSLKLHKEGEMLDDESDCIEDQDYSSLSYVELIKVYNELESKYVLCTSLLNRLEMSNFEHRLVRRRLQEMKKRKDGMIDLNNNRNRGRNRTNLNRNNDYVLDEI